MIEEFVKTVMSKNLKETMPHLEQPPIVYAKVTKVKELPLEYQIEMKHRRKNGGTDEDYIYTGKWQEYNLKVLDRDGNIDENFPELPSVKSKEQINAGSKIAVGLIYGELNPVILCEVM